MYTCIEKVIGSSRAREEGKYTRRYLGTKFVRKGEVKRNTVFRGAQLRRLLHLFLLSTLDMHVHTADYLSGRGQ